MDLSHHYLVQIGAGLDDDTSDRGEHTERTPLGLRTVGPALLVLSAAGSS